MLAPTKLDEIGIDRKSFDSFFYSDFFLYRGPFEPEEYGHNDTDVNEKYINNSLGFRSPEFHVDTDTLFAGCSHTYGVGLAEGTSWSEQVASKTGNDYVNLSQPGLSVYSIVASIMNYCLQYGNPKRIYCMMPELGRMQTFLDEGVVTSKYKKMHGLNEVIVSHIDNTDEIPGFIKKPFYVEDTTTKQMCYYYSLKAIQFLELFAKNSGIELVWSMFNGNDHELIKFLNEKNDKYYTCFIDTKQGNWTKDENQEDLYLDGDARTMKVTPLHCHEDLRPVYGDKFGIAGDIERGRQGAHHGVHRHVHVAEAFLNHINK